MVAAPDVCAAGVKRARCLCRERRRFHIRSRMVFCRHFLHAPLARGIEAVKKNRREKRQRNCRKDASHAAPIKGWRSAYSGP